MADGSFQELFQRAVNGDRDAQADLYLEYGRHLRRCIAFRLRRMKIAYAVDPDDLFDSFFGRIIEGRVKIAFKSPLHFINYCEKSLHNKCQQALRSVMLRKATNIAECPPELFEDASATDQLERFERNEELESAYSELTHEERVVCFFRAGGHTWKEVGQRLGKSASAVRMLHRRADERLQNELLAGDAF